MDADRTSPAPRFYKVPIDPGLKNPLWAIHVLTQKKVSQIVGEAIQEYVERRGIKAKIVALQYKASYKFQDVEEPTSA